MSPRTPTDISLDATDFFNEGQPGAVLDPPAADAGETFDLGSTVEGDRFAAEPEGVHATVPEEFQPAPYRGWVGTLLTGATFFVLGVGLAVWSVTAPESIPELISNFGVTPFALSATGAILWALAWSRRGQTDVGNRTDRYVAPLHDMLAYVSTRAEVAVEAEDFNRTLIALQRLDEKIQNLSRATKMYGKPLMDVASKVQEAARQLQEIEGSLNGVVHQVETSSTRLGADLEHLIEATKDGFPTEQFEALVAATRASASMLSEFKSDFDQVPDTNPSIQELREAMDTVRAELDQLAGGVQTELDKLGTSLRTDFGDLGGSLHAKVSELDGTIRGELEGLGGTLRGEMEGLDGTIRGELEGLGGALRGEMGGLGEAITSLEKRALAAAAQATAASTRVAKPTPSAPTKSASRPAAASSDSAAPSKPGVGGLASSIAGKRKSKGKNVLGAIAKLKQMRD